MKLWPSFCHTSCLRIFIRRKTVLRRKMFIPAIRKPIDTIKGKFSDLKSLTLKTNNKAPMIVAVQAIHFSVSAAFLSLFITQDPCPCSFTIHFYEHIVTQNSFVVHVFFKFLLKICQNFFCKPIGTYLVTFFLCVTNVKASRRYCYIIYVVNGFIHPDLSSKVVCRWSLPTKEAESAS